MFIDSRKCGRRERRLARVIAYYNFSAMLPKLWALPRGWALPPKNHEQEVSLSLHPPLGDTIPKTPKTIHQIFKNIMAEISCINIKPCNIGSSEAHNRRTEQYMAHINENDVYIRRDLTSDNEAWVSPEYGEKTLQQCYDDIAVMVKEKTGKALQTKSRERVDKKTGKVKKVAGSSPIREGVVLIKPDTTMDDLVRFTQECQKRWGICAIQIFIHRDEGHYDTMDNVGKSEWKSNCHAHILFDWMDHATGKSWKLDKKAMSDLQTLAAETLNMERGKSKEETGREHLERNDFILAKQKEETAQVLADKKKAEIEKHEAQMQVRAANREKGRLDSEIEKRQLESDRLDKEIADKEERARMADKANTNGIKHGVANLLGMGKYAAIEKRNKELEESVLKEKQRLQKQFAAAVRQEVEKAVAPYEQQKNADRLLINALQSKVSVLSESNMELSSRNSRMKSRHQTDLEWRDRLLRIFAEMFYQVKEFFRKAVDAIISLATPDRQGRHREIFRNEEAAAIKETMNEFADTESGRISIGKWLVDYASSMAELSDLDIHHAQGEVVGVAQGRYNRRIERGERNMSL